MEENENVVISFEIEWYTKQTNKITIKIPYVKETFNNEDLEKMKAAWERRFYKILKSLSKCYDEFAFTIATPAPTNLKEETVIQYGGEGIEITVDDGTDKMQKFFDKHLRAMFAIPIAKRNILETERWLAMMLGKGNVVKGLDEIIAMFDAYYADADEEETVEKE